MKEQRIFQALAEAGQGTARRIGDLIDMGVLESYERLRLMETKGLAETFREGNRTLFRLTSAGKTVARDEGWTVS